MNETAMWAEPRLVSRYGEKVARSLSQEELVDAQHVICYTIDMGVTCNMLRKVNLFCKVQLWETIKLFFAVELHPQCKVT